MLRMIAAVCLVSAGAVLLAVSAPAQQGREFPTGYDGVELDMRVEALKARRRVELQPTQDPGVEVYRDRSRTAFLGESLRGEYGFYDGHLKSIQFISLIPMASAKACVGTLDQWVQPFAKRYGPFDPPVVAWASRASQTWPLVQADKKYQGRRVTISAEYLAGGECKRIIGYHLSFMWNGQRYD